MHPGPSVDALHFHARALMGCSSPTSPWWKNRHCRRLPTVVGAVSTSARTVARRSGPGTLSARTSDDRCSARSRHSALGCRYAPRPGRPRPRSITQVSPCITMRTSCLASSRDRHPMQVRTGPETRSAHKSNSELHDCGQGRLHRVWSQGGCRYAIRSGGRPAAHSGPRGRWPRTAGSRARIPGPPSRLDPRS